MGRSLTSSQVDAHRDSTGNTKKTRSPGLHWLFDTFSSFHCCVTILIHWKYVLRSLLVWPGLTYPELPTIPTVYALGQTSVLFPSALKHTPKPLSLLHVIFLCLLLLDRSTEGVGKEVGAVSLVLQSLHKDFSILLKGSVRDRHPQFSLQQTYREKLHFLFEVCFFCCFPQWELDQSLMLSTYKISTSMYKITLLQISFRFVYSLQPILFQEGEEQINKKLSSSVIGLLFRNLCGFWSQC